MVKKQRGMRFGVMAVEKGYITPDQLGDALKIQVQENLAGYEHRKIGEILLDQGTITLDEINEVLIALSEQQE